MSLYGAFDYLDVLSRDSRSTSRRSNDDNSGESSSSPDDSSLDLLVLDDAVSSTVAESENTTLPSEVFMSSSEDGMSGEGLVILPSIPSEEVAAALELQQRQMQALSMQVPGAPHTTRNAHSIISLATTESHFTDIVDNHNHNDDDDSPSSVSSLSLSVSTLPSSGFTEEIVFERDSNGSVATSSSSSSSSSEESTRVRDAPQTPCVEWYSHLKTEQDWEAFRAERLALVQALGEDCPKDPDEMLAQLIAQEEEQLQYYYKIKTKRSTCLGMSYETVAMMVGAAIVPLVGYALLSRSRRTRAD